MEHYYGYDIRVMAAWYDVDTVRTRSGFRSGLLLFLYTGLLSLSGKWIVCCLAVGVDLVVGVSLCVCWCVCLYVCLYLAHRDRE